MHTGTSIFAQSSWPEEKARQHAQAQQDSSQWDPTLLKRDIKDLGKLRVPMQQGAFPVAAYDSPGTGVWFSQLGIGSRELIGRHLLLGKGEMNEKKLAAAELEDEIVFSIFVLSGKEKESLATSRNHPLYLAEGRIKTAAGPVEWMAIHRPDGQSMAIVNTRVFDLRFGQTILVAPQQDKSLRFLQLEAPLFSRKTLPTYLRELQQMEQVKNFLQQAGNID